MLAVVQAFLPMVISKYRTIVYKHGATEVVHDCACMNQVTPHQILTLQGPVMMKMVVMNTMDPPPMGPPQTGLRLCILVAVTVYKCFRTSGDQG